jgi:hypothetical protein
MADVGRPTALDNDLLRKIKQSILDGNDLKKTANVCEIPESTLYTWHSDNYLTLADKIEGWRRDRKLMLANENIVKILQLDINDKDFVKTVSDMSKFVAETLDKKNYSKRTENTGADGKDLVVNVVNYGNNTTSQLHTEELPDTSDTSS